MARDTGAIPVLMAALPVLAVQFGVGFVRFQSRRKRSVRAFRRALVGSGMPRDQAAVLAQRYHEVGSLRTILRGAASRPAVPGAAGEP